MSARVSDFIWTPLAKAIVPALIALAELRERRNA